MLGAHVIEGADRQARKGFTYRSDPAAFDNWRSHADEAIHGRQWEGDCDDLTSTVLDLLGSVHNVPLAERYRLLVASNGGRAIDHMVGCVRVDRRFLIVGDTFGPMYPALNMQHRPVLYQRMDEARAGIWRQGVPWS